MCTTCCVSAARSTAAVLGVVRGSPVKACCTCCPQKPSCAPCQANNCTVPLCACAPCQATHCTVRSRGLQLIASQPPCLCWAHVFVFLVCVLAVLANIVLQCRQRTTFSHTNVGCCALQAPPPFQHSSSSAGGCERTLQHTAAICVQAMSLTASVSVRNCSLQIKTDTVQNASALHWVHPVSYAADACPAKQCSRTGLW